MQILRAVPQDWFTWNFTLFNDDDEEVAGITPAWFSESAEIYTGGEMYKAYRESWMSGAFIFQLNDSILAKAEKPSALNRSFNVEFDGRQYILEAEAVFFRKFILIDNGVEVGSITPENALTSAAVLDLPRDIPLPVKAFMFWLVMILWKRDADSTAHSIST